MKTAPSPGSNHKKSKNTWLNPQRLRSFIPLQGLTEESLVILVKNATLFRLARGNILFEYGDCSPYSYLLLAGELEAHAKDGTKSIVIADIDQGLYPIGSLIPRQISVMVLSNTAILIKIDRNILEKELAWGQAGSDGKLVLCELSGLPGENHAWMINLLHTPVFFRLPMSNIQLLFQRFNEVQYARADVVVKEGDPGDKYFIIRSGICKITRNSWGKDITLGTLKAPEGFGEQALISDQPRSATVIMETAGTLMSLSKKDFIALMQAPLQKRISLSDAMNLVWSNKGRLIDVRNEVEFNRGHLVYLETCGDPATGLPFGHTADNLKTAVAGETHEYTDMYPGMAKTAREEGFEEISDWFETLAKADRSHANRYQKALNDLG